MEAKEKFTFFRSFWEAVKRLPKKDRYPILEAIIEYGLDGREPESLSDAQFAYFLLVEPVLSKSRNRAESGKQGGSKPKANAKQTLTHKDIHKEKEIKDIQKDKERDKQIQREADFERFWKAYPRKVDKQGTLKAFLKVTESVDILVGAVERQKQSSQWLKDDGQFIPHPKTWLNQERWNDELPLAGNAFKDGSPKGASGVLGEAEMEAIQRILREG